MIATPVIGASWAWPKASYSTTSRPGDASPNHWSWGYIIFPIILTVGLAHFTYMKANLRLLIGNWLLRLSLAILAQPKRRLSYGSWVERLQTTASYLVKTISR